MRGIVFIDRASFDHEYFSGTPYAYRCAWFWLIAKANWDEKGEKKVGELTTTIRELAGVWGWSNDKVLKFLNGLEQRSMILSDRTQRRTIITIPNYSKYQNYLRGRKTATERLSERKPNDSPDLSLLSKAPNTVLSSLRSESVPTQPKKKQERVRLSKEERHAERKAAGKSLAKGCEYVYLDEHDKQLIKEHWLSQNMTMGDMLDGVRKLDGHFANKPLAFREQCDHRASMNGWVLKAIREDKLSAVRLNNAQNQNTGRLDAYDKREQVRAKERAAVERASAGQASQPSLLRIIAGGGKGGDS